MLEMLAGELDDTWKDEDPRWYRDIHAGLFLIEFQERAAIPLFDKILRDEEQEDLVGEWFARQLPTFGHPIVPVLKALIKDEQALQGGRLTAIDMLGDIGKIYPEEKPEIVRFLRSLLPPLNEEGLLDLTLDLDEIEETQIDLWTWTVWALLDLRDTVSRPQVIALYMEDLVDEGIVGDMNEYLEELEREASGEEKEPPPDIFTFYQTLYEWDSMDDGAFYDVVRSMLVDSGMDEEDADEIIFDAMVDMEEEVESEDQALADPLIEGMLDGMRQILREQGIPESELDEAAADLLVAMAPAFLEQEFSVEGEEDDFYLEDREEPRINFLPERGHPGRNDPCSCGSGRKYKHCCGRHN